MRHLKDRRKLGIHSSHKQAVLKNLLRSLVINGAVDTTLARARVLKRLADKMITLGKKDTVHARRLAFRLMPDRNLISKLFTDLAKKFSDRTGGYTRVYRLGFRNGDNAELVKIEFVLPRVAKVKSEKTEKKTEKSKAEKKAKAKAKEIDVKKDDQSLKNKARQPKGLVRKIREKTQGRSSSSSG